MIHEIDGRYGLQVKTLFLHVPGHPAHAAPDPDGPPGDSRYGYGRFPVTCPSGTA